MSKKVKKGKKTISWKRAKKRMERQKHARQYRSGIWRPENQNQMVFGKPVEPPEKRLTPSTQEKALNMINAKPSPLKRATQAINSLLFRSAKVTPNAG